MIQRHLESTLRRLAASFPIVAVTGARQGWPLGGAQHRVRCKSKSNLWLARRAKEWERLSQMTRMNTNKTDDEILRRSRSLIVKICSIGS